MLSTNELWESYDEKEWRNALDKYWNFVKPTHLEVEKEFDLITSETIKTWSLDGALQQSLIFNPLTGKLAALKQLPVLTLLS